MELNFIGVFSALTAFSGIAIGHVAVRRIEFRVSRLRIPFFLFLASGIAMEFLSLLVTNLYAKTILGILGFIFFWDAIELLRQQQRVWRGHAPANPNNPRHRRFLDTPSSSATTMDLLRDEIDPNLKIRQNN